MTETKTETLADVLRDLAELAPGRFKYKHEAWFVHRCGMWPRVSLIAPLDEDCIAGACQEECEARGLTVVHWRYDGYSEYTIYPSIAAARRDSGWLSYSDDVSAALAIATALRDALRAEQ